MDGRRAGARAGNCTAYEHARVWHTRKSAPPITPFVDDVCEIASGPTLDNQMLVRHPEAGMHGVAHQTCAGAGRMHAQLTGQQLPCDHLPTSEATNNLKPLRRSTTSRRHPPAGLRPGPAPHASHTARLPDLSLRGVTVLAAGCGASPHGLQCREATWPH